MILPAGLTKLSDTLPAGMLNVGTFPDYIAGGEAQPVAGANNAVVCVTFSLMAMVDDPQLIYLAPASIQSIPGTMALADGLDPSILISCYPSSNDYANPVFGVNASVVATEDSSWGDVKALFR